MEQLLSTKFYIPPTRLKLVSRPHHIRRINEGLHRKLTLISAPAGFGKTTLVSEWVEKSNSDTQNGIRIAWLSLDDSDNDLVRFLTYIIAALRQSEGVEDTLGEDSLNMLQTPQPPPTETILTALINDIATISNKIILVLDDYHLISQPTIDDALSFLLENLPPQLHLIIITRVDPQLPLARLRAGSQLNELRAADLRFSTSEAAEFLNEAMGLTLSEEDITSLESRTEGWIAGLQLAAISMRGREDSSSLIKSFTGSHRLVLDYLVEEVMDQQSKNLKSFLLHTAILDRMNGSLCDALTDQENGQETLEYLEQANLFIVPLDNDRSWFRYHHLFAELLRQRMHQTMPAQITALQIQASEWFKKNGFPEEAIQYSLRAGDFERSAGMIEKQGEVFWGRGQHTNLGSWLMKLPIELIYAKPNLCILHAWDCILKGQLDAAELSLQAVDQAFISNTDDQPQTDNDEKGSSKESERDKLKGRIGTVRALMSGYKGDLEGIIQHAEDALDYLPLQDLPWRSVTAILLGDSHGFRGDMAAAYQARLEAVKACKAAGVIYFIIVANLKVAITLRAQGRLQETVEICEQQMQLAKDYNLSQVPIAGWLLAVWGETLAETNDLERGLGLAIEGFELAKQFQHWDVLGWCYMCLIRIYFSLGDLDSIHETIQKVENITHEHVVPFWFTNLITASKAQLSLAQGKLELAEQWTEEGELKKNGQSKKLKGVMQFFLLLDYILYARILFAQGRLDDATNLLHHLLEAAESGGRTSRLVEIIILQALILSAQNKTGQSLNTLERALNLAQPEGFIRTFVDEGPPMAKLLYEALERGISPDYVSHLLTTFSESESEQQSPVKIHDKNAKLIEPLSNREIEVLQLIADGLTNKEIADRLFLSLNTIKVHIRNIFGKLDVNNRAQAITRGKALGILDPTDAP